MKINGVNETSAQSIQFKGTNQTDSVSKNIQNQIADAQKQLMDLSANEEMTPDAKMQKRQELLKKITELEMQLSQHQAPKRKEKTKKSGNAFADMIGGSRKGKAKKGNGQGPGLSQSSMQAIIAADASLSQAQVQGRAASQNEGRANVLKAEIKQDAALGGNTEAKEAQLAKVEQTAAQATEAQMNTLARANDEIENATKEDSESKSNKDEKTDKKNGMVADDDAQVADYKPIDISL